MLIEIFAFLGIMTIVMFTFADMKNYGAIRIIASFILFMLAFWILSDGVQYQVGESINATETQTTINATTELSRVETTTYLYDTLVWPYEETFKLNHVMFIILIFMSFYGFLTYRGESKSRY